MSDLGARFINSPIHRVSFEIDQAGIQLLADRYKERIFRARRTDAGNKLLWHTLILRFAENVFIHARGRGDDWIEIFAPTEEEALALCAEIRKKLNNQHQAGSPFFYMLRYNYSEFQVERVDLDVEKTSEEFLQLCYGSDVLRWLDGFALKTANRTGGLTIFEGPHGTGKTSLITAMMRRLAASHVFYVLPVAHDDALTAPELVSFWQEQNKRHPDRVKVAVLEDAERLLWSRRSDNREAVSSLLNIADGFIGRMLRLHILCSVNAKTSEIDPAILRPGRLMNYRTFCSLPRSAAQQLAELKSLPFHFAAERDTLTLAEVMNPEAFAPEPPTHIGFQK